MSKNRSLKYCSYPGRLEVTSSNAVIMQNIFGTLLQKCSLSEFISLRSQSVSLLSGLTLSLTLTSTTHFDLPFYPPYLILNGFSY